MAKIDTDSPILLQILPQTPEGLSKDTEIASAVVRVYHVDSGVEVVDLTTTALTHIPTSRVFRYMWEPTSLPENHYLAEYTLEDLDGVTVMTTEDIIVGQMDAPTVNDIDDKLSDEHGDGSWESTANPCGKPNAIPGV